MKVKLCQIVMKEKKVGRKEMNEKQRNGDEK